MKKKIYIFSAIQREKTYLLLRRYGGTAGIPLVSISKASLALDIKIATPM